MIVLCKEELNYIGVDVVSNVTVALIESVGGVLLKLEEAMGRVTDL